MNSRLTSSPANYHAAEARAGELQPPALTALGVQLAAGLAVLIMAYGWHCAGIMLPAGLWVLLQGMFAIALAYLVGMERWWLPIHLLFFPLAALAWSWHLPPYIFLAGFLALILVHGATYRTRVPTHLSRLGAIRAAAALLPEQPGFRCLDLGCGTGGVLAAFTRLRPEGRYSGIEGAILPCLVSWLRGRRDGFRVSWGDIWEENLSSYDVVYAFLSPACMPRLWRKAVREMRPGTCLISNEFAIPGVASGSSIPVPGTEGALLHVWRIPERAG